MEKKETQTLEEKSVEAPKDDPTAKKDLWKKMADAIPERHVGKLLIFMLVVIVLGIGFNFYSAFWGGPRLRSELKAKNAEVEMLQKDLELVRSGNVNADLPLEESLPDEIVLDEFNTNTPDSVIFNAYGDGVEPEL